MNQITSTHKNFLGTSFAREKEMSVCQCARAPTSVRLYVYKDVSSHALAHLSKDALRHPQKILAASLLKMRGNVMKRRIFMRWHAPKLRHLNTAWKSPGHTFFTRERDVCLSVWHDDNVAFVWPHQTISLFCLLGWKFSASQLSLHVRVEYSLSMAGSTNFYVVLLACLSLLERKKLRDCWV